jgi:hypothetical protein
LLSDFASFGPQEKIPENARWGRSLRYCGHRHLPLDARLAAVHIDATGAAFAVISGMKVALVRSGEPRAVAVPASAACRRLPHHRAMANE